MDEDEVTYLTKKYLTKNGWKVRTVVNAGHIGKERFIPDIIAVKQEKMMTVECKGSIELGELVRGIGQCIVHSYYGNNIICFAVPEDKKEQSMLLVDKVNVAGGRIGLFVIGKDRVDLVRNWKEITPQRLSKEFSVDEDVFKFIRDPFIGYILLGSINKGIVYPYLMLKKFKQSKSKFLSSINKFQVYNTLNYLEKCKAISTKMQRVGRRIHKSYTLTKIGMSMLKDAPRVMDETYALAHDGLKM